MSEAPIQSDCFTEDAHISRAKTLENVDIPSLLQNSSALATGMRAHIDSIKSQSFVQFRWTAYIPELVPDPSSQAQKMSNAPFKLKVIGCSNTEHWQRKHLDVESMTTGCELVNQQLVISKVLSPFEVYQNLPESFTKSISTEGSKLGSPNHMSWAACDDHVWTLARQLRLLPEDQFKSSMCVEFPEDLKRAPPDNVGHLCSSHCQYLDSIVPRIRKPVPKIRQPLSIKREPLAEAYTVAEEPPLKMRAIDGPELQFGRSGATPLSGAVL
jgi:hypothetical protein